MYTTIDRCRACHGKELIPIFNLGEQYVSNFVDKDQVTSGIKVPIELVQCPACTLVQQEHTAPQDFLYTRFYWYRSGVTQSMRNALQDVTEAAERLVALQSNDMVLDIGANDGTLLRSYRVPCTKVAVEPARNLWEECKTSCNYLIPDFWGATNDNREDWNWPSIMKFRGTPEGKAKVVTALGMFYDLEDPNQFIADVAKVLAPDGIFIAQLMCLKNMLDIGDVGNLCHEHLEFYTLHSLQLLFDKYGLRIFDIEENNVNGRSYRLYICHREGPFQEQQQAVKYLSLDWPFNDPGLLRWKFGKWEKNRDGCVRFIKEEVAKGKKVWIYGSSTKGNVILQFYGLDHTLIEAAADRSPEKWGKFTVGTGIRIASEAEFREANPDYALVLPYAFREEFIAREKEWLSKGNHFIFPLPRFEIV